MPPLSLMIKPVSGLCNMRCTYCFYGDEMARREEGAFAPMDEETLRLIVRRAFLCADSTVSFVFQGGEPTLAGAVFFRALLKLEEEYNARGLEVRHAIQTNGYRLDDDLLDVLARGRFLVGVSVDGAKEIHDSRRLDAARQGTYDRVMANVERLRGAGIEYNILCVVDQRVAQAPEETFDTLRRHGYLQFIPCLDPLDGRKGPDSLDAVTYGRFLCRVFDRYEAAIRGGRYVSVRLFDNWLGMLCGQPPEACGMMGRCMPNFLVESNGNVYPCDFFALDEWLLGNVKRQNFVQLAKSPRLNEFCRGSCPVSEPCKTCPWYALCLGGCRRDRVPFENGLPRLNRLCEGYRVFFEACYDRLAALSRLTPVAPPKTW